MVSAQADNKENISLELLLYGRTGWYSFPWENLTPYNPLSKQSGGHSAPTYT